MRALMIEIKAREVCPDDMVRFMSHMVDKFSRDTSITAKFIADCDEVSLPPQICREFVQILQEALVNVRKHSNARHALVRFSSSEQAWHLSIEDDGKGFDFEGLMTHDQLERKQTGPAVIKERVRLIHGKLEIESNPGRGSAVKIHLAKHIYA